MLNLHQIVGRPWAVMPELAESVQRILEAEGYGALRRGAEFHAAWDRKDGDQAAAGRSTRPQGAIAIVPLMGVITQRGDEIDSQETASSALFARAVAAAASDSAVDAIVLEIDSPGGEVYGVAEAAAAIRQARDQKPIVASANSLAASAAYWLASQASQLLVTPSGEVGSIGVYAAHQDVSAAMEKRGVKVTLIHAGKYKVEGHPYGALDDEARTDMQAGVDRYYDMFVRDVAKGRGASLETVRKEFGEGRVVGAKAAVERGMADAVGTLQDAIKKAAALAREQRGSAGASAQAEAMKTRRARG